MRSIQAIVTFLIVTLLGSTVEAKEKHVGCYYGVWAYTRPGVGEFWPEDIDVELCDVIYYGFGNILNGTFDICSWDPWFDMAMSDQVDHTIQNCIQERDGIAWPTGCYTDAGLEYCHYDGMRRTIALKEKNPDLKVLFSVGGWTAGGWIFSDMASTKANRAKFIHSAIHFMKYFGFDGLDVDWEYPGFDMLPEVPTDPADREHFTLLMKELRQAFDVDGFLLTFAAAPDPFKADNAYELDKLVESVHWINMMTYDYSGPWDNYTGIDQPLYGRWGEGFTGHPKKGFNMHETIQYYLQSFPPEQLVLGIHSESKGWILANNSANNIYCPAYQSPNMTYSRQEGWLNYYEILQFWYNETIEDPLWSDLEPGKDKWTISDHEHGNVDGCYLSPYMSQGRYFISYDDQDSADVKVRYANHYGLKGAFVWEVDTDNFMGPIGPYEKYNILNSINRAIVSGKGLEEHEILGKANDNLNCSPQVPFCDPPFDMPDTCTLNSDCNDDNSVICNDDLTNCFYCDEGLCKPGCSDNQNCPDSAPVCNGDHVCIPNPDGLPVLTKITIKTKSCTGCSYSLVENGVQLHLDGRFGAKCSTNSLDNPAEHDYVDGKEAVFNSTINADSVEMGLGDCNNYDLNIGLTAATATWTGEGSWTPEPDKPICINFYDTDNSNPTCCCDLPQPSLSSEDGEVHLDCSNSCFMP